MQTVKRVEVDTNFSWYGGHTPALSREDVARLGLKPGERVVAFMPGDDRDVWNGTVRFDPSVPEHYHWYVELDR